MPNPDKPHIPSYCKHKGSGQAVVTLNGRDIYLGVHGSAASRQEYDRVTREWLENGRQLPASGHDLTVVEVIRACWRFAQEHYRRDSGSSRSVLASGRARHPRAGAGGVRIRRDGSSGSE